MPAAVDHDARRGQIAEAVWATVSQHGIEGATMRRVAAAGDVSVGRIQHYFRSRDEMLRHACQAMVDLAAGAVDDGPGGEQGPDRPEGDGDDADAAMRAVRHLLTHAFDQSTAYRLGARVWSAFVAHAVVDEGIATIVVRAQRGLEQQVGQLLLAAGRDPRAARSLVALSEGLAQRTLTGALTEADARQAVDAALRRDAS